MNQSSEDFFYLTHIVRIVLETSILLSFRCIDAFYVYIFDVYAKKLRTERSEIQQGIIQQLSCKVKQRKNFFTKLT